MNKKKVKKIFKKVWYFIWEDNSVWSWMVNVVLAFVLIKFIVYPGLGLILSTTHPIVAVVSSSMEHRSVPSCLDYEEFGIFGKNIDYCTKNTFRMCGNSYSKKEFFNLGEYWNECGSWYKTNTDISQKDFSKFSLKNGFNKGSIIMLIGKKPEDIKIGDVIVFKGTRPEPIIHRVVRKWEENNEYFFHTKGDNNADSIRDRSQNSDKLHQSLDETRIHQDQVIGKALVRVPFLGYIKIWFVGFLQFIGIIK